MVFSFNFMVFVFSLNLFVIEIRKFICSTSENEEHDVYESCESYVTTHRGVTQIFSCNTNNLLEIPNPHQITKSKYVVRTYSKSTSNNQI
jgi:hypothetical protein